MIDRNEPPTQATAATPPKKKRKTAFDIRFPALSTHAITATAVLLYGFGFVVANVYYARFQITALDLLQTRYISAALIFAFTTLIPFSGGFILGGLIGDLGWKHVFGAPFEPAWSLQLLIGSLVVIGLPAGAFFLLGKTVLLDEAQVPYKWPAFALLLLAGLLTGAMAGEGEEELTEADPSEDQPSSEIPSDSVSNLYPGTLVLLLLVVWAFLFGNHVYPEIPRALEVALLGSDGSHLQIVSLFNCSGSRETTKSSSLTETQTAQRSWGAAHRRIRRSQSASAMATSSG